MFLHVKFRIFFCVIICYYGSVNIGCKECGIEWWMLKEIFAFPVFDSRFEVLSKPKL